MKPPAGKIVLIGFMAAGKTNAAKAIGDGAVDVDTVIEARIGREVQEIFATDGEGAFRELEERTTLELLDNPEITAVALGSYFTWIRQRSRQLRKTLRDENRD